MKSKLSIKRLPIKNATDAKRAKEYLLGRCKSQFLVRGTMTEQALIKSLDLYDFSDTDKDSLEVDLQNFHRLCTRNLDDEQWAALKNELRLQRAKDSTILIQVELTGEAHGRLQKFIDKEAIRTGEKLTLSDAILKSVSA